MLLWQVFISALHINIKALFPLLELLLVLEFLAVGLLESPLLILLLKHPYVLVIGHILANLVGLGVSTRWTSRVVPIILH